MKQFDMKGVLQRHKVIPVVTITDLNDVDAVAEKILQNGVACVEITLRSEVAFEAIKLFKQKYGDKMDVGVGTIVYADQIKQAAELEVDFMVSPGFSPDLDVHFQEAKTPFIVGVNTPSEVMQGMSLGYDTFKFFPAKLAGGTKMLKTLGTVFPNVVFCPTGGITAESCEDYLALNNVLSVGGSWMS